MLRMKLCSSLQFANKASSGWSDEGSKRNLFCPGQPSSLKENKFSISMGNSYVNLDFENIKNSQSHIILSITFHKFVLLYAQGRSYEATHTHTTYLSIILTLCHKILAEKKNNNKKMFNKIPVTTT